MPNTNITTIKLEAMLVEGLKADQDFQQQLQALKEAHLKQLQETQRRQSEELAKRIHRDALLSTDKEDKSEEERNLNGIFRPSRWQTTATHCVFVTCDIFLLCIWMMLNPFFFIYQTTWTFSIVLLARFHFRLRSYITCHSLSFWTHFPVTHQCPVSRSTNTHTHILNQLFLPHTWQSKEIQFHLCPGFRQGDSSRKPAVKKTYPILSGPGHLPDRYHP